MTREKTQYSDFWASPQRYFYFRSLIAFSVVGSLVSYRSWPEFDITSIALSILTLCYLGLTRYLSEKKYSDEQKENLERYFGWVDAALIGACLCLVDFQILPTVLFATIIQFNAALQGGSRKWLEDNAAFFIGAGTGGFLYTPVWVLSSSVQISATTLIGVSVYIVLYGLYLNSKLRSASKRIAELTEVTEKEKAKGFLLSRYISPAVYSAISTDNENRLQTERKRLTVFFSDIQGFTSLSEELEAETLSTLLNLYLTEMTKIIAHFGGTVDKFMGDGIMVIFGDHESKGVKTDCIRCVSMAIAMKKRMRVLQNHWFSQGIKKKLQIRMGINTGYCTVGTFGTRAHHLDYTALGTHVNLASRLESAADPGEILLSHESWALVKDTIMCTNKGMIEAKGFSYPIEVYEVVDFRKNLGAHQTYMESNAEGFSMHLDLEKVRNFEKEKVIYDLEKALQTIKDRVIQ